MDEPFGRGYEKDLLPERWSYMFRYGFVDCFSKDFRSICKYPIRISDI